MSLKRAKSEIKTVNRLGDMLHHKDLMGHVCLFLANTDLPGFKPATKKTNALVNSVKQLSDRWKRGVLERYKEHQWAHNRVGLITGIEGKKVVVDCFLVCWTCHGVYDRRVPDRWTNRWLATVKPANLICMACGAREVMVKEAREGPIAAVEKETVSMRTFLRVIEKQLVTNRLMVQRQRMYDPVDHMKGLRKFFPDCDTDDDESTSEPDDDGDDYDGD